MAALPLQGFAAVKLCSGRDIPMCIDTIAHAAPPASAAQHHHCDQESHSSTLTHDHCKSSTCCTTCHAGAAVLPANPVFMPVLLNFAATALSPEPLVTGYIPAGLERPPRPFSA